MVKNNNNVIMSGTLNEIEIKYSLKSSEIPVVEDLISKNNGKFIKKQRECDVYFNVANRDSIKTKECLRIRSIFNLSGDLKSGEITYKPPSTKKDNGHFAKIETNLPILDIDTAKNFLKLIGNEILVEIIKERTYYQISDCHIVIDQVDGAGVFLEIETMDSNREIGLQKIENLNKILGLNGKRVENRPYRDILLNK